MGHTSEYLYFFTKNVKKGFLLTRCMELFQGLRLIVIKENKGAYSFEDKNYGPALIVPEGHRIKDGLPNVLLTFGRKDGKCFVYTGYIKNVAKFANPFILHQMSERDLVHILNQNIFSHVIFVGGIDINPKHYSGDSKLAEEIDDRRDDFELFLFQEATRRNYPVLGICRGIQLINIACGGTLKNLKNHRAKDKKMLMHSVVIPKNSWLFPLYKGSLEVNSFHHQAIDRLGKDLHICATADDGTIESIQHMKSQIYGVQWHPEEINSGEKIFEHFFKQ